MQLQASLVLQLRAQASGHGLEAAHGGTAVPRRQQRRRWGKARQGFRHPSTRACRPRGPSAPGPSHLGSAMPSPGFSFHFQDRNGRTLATGEASSVASNTGPTSVSGGPSVARGPDPADPAATSDPPPNRANFRRPLTPFQGSGAGSPGGQLRGAAGPPGSGPGRTPHSRRMTTSSWVARRPLRDPLVASSLVPAGRVGQGVRGSEAALHSGPASKGRTGRAQSDTA